MSKKTTEKMRKATQAEAVSQTPEATPEDPETQLYDLKNSPGLKLSFSTSNPYRIEFNVSSHMRKAMVLAHAINTEINIKDGIPGEEAEQFCDLVDMIRAELEIAYIAWGKFASACYQMVKSPQ